MSYGAIDIVIVFYILWQAYIGYTKGFEKILYDFVKYIAIIFGLFFSSKFLWPFLITFPKFMEYSEKINNLVQEFLLQFAPRNFISNAIYIKTITIFPYEKIFFGIIISVLIVLFLRILIYGSIVKEESEHKKLGMLFSIIKSIILLFVLINITTFFMGKEYFLKIIEGSFILKNLPIKII